jgi:multidrug efflux pump subunit AcrB
VPTISVQAFTIPGVSPPEAFADVRGAIEAMALPPGYRMEWGGEHESAGQAQESLGRQMPLAFGTKLLITILLFGRLRQTAVIWTIVPMAVNGAALGLLFTGLPFSFTALLGLLSLSGMLIKNAIVLVEEIDAQKEEAGLPQSEAIVAASVSRLRPVVLASGTTILGMAPLLWDVFFASMAVTIMAGLGFASILTLVGVPGLYHSYLRAERRAEAAPDADQDEARSDEAPARRIAAE